MDPQKRKLFLLVALLGIWGLLFALRTPSRVPGNPSGPPRSPVAPDGGLPRLKTALLPGPPRAYPPEGAPLFGSPPPPPPSPVAVAPGAPPPPDPFQEEVKRLRYVGFLKAGDRVQAFLVQDQEVHTLEVGATLSAQIRVQAITEEAVTLTSPSGDQQARLPLTPEARPGVRR